MVSQKRPEVEDYRIQMLHDLTTDDGHAAFKRAAEERNSWRNSGMMPETCSTAEDLKKIQIDGQFYCGGKFRHQIA